MKYSIVIPTYNLCGTFLKPCVESILAYSHMTDVELIISANGCVDETKSYVENLRTQFTALGFEKHIKIVWSDAALGYAGACNAGIQASTADLIVLLNNDTLVLPSPRNSWLELLEAPFFSDDRCGISCTNLLHSPISNSAFAVFFCVMIHRKVFDQVGMLNEIYSIGAGEDTEFCWLAERAGFTIHEALPNEWSDQLQTWVGGFPLYHKGEGTMHDESLVQNWRETFTRNGELLTNRYKEIFSPETRLNHISKWIKTTTPEATELWEEVVEGNIYHVTDAMIRNTHVIDIGANMGSFGLLAACMGAKKVTCVEPVAATFNVLQKNIACAHFHDVIKPVKAIVAPQAYEIATIWTQDKTGYSSLFDQKGLPEQVVTTTLEQLINQSQDAVFLKLDCEGSEYDILMTVPDHIMTRVRHVALEIHANLHPRHKGAQILYDRLTAWGFRMLYKNQMVLFNVNSSGERVYVKDLPETVEIWSK